MSRSEEERREFRRVRAPVFCRPVGITLRLLAERSRATDISLGGMRIYADEAPKKGTRLEIEMFLPEGASVTCKVEVVWIDELPAATPARYDVGLRFVDIRDDDRKRLGAVLDEH